MIDRSRWQVVVTCEHASRAIPRELRDLGLPAAVRASHRAWDPGAAEVAKALAAELDAPLHLGKWSRLVVDLNRNPRNAWIIARRLDGADVPGNQIDDGARTWRIAKYWSPWRKAAQADIVAAAARGVALHVSVHSFTPELHGIVRPNDVGLLHDPDRGWEVDLCDEIKPHFAAAGLSVRRNFPYFGNTDGFASHLRHELAPKDYVGIEIECNQRVVVDREGQQRVAKALIAALREVLAA